MNEQEPKKPNLNPALKIYEKTGRFSRKTDEEIDKKVKENAEKRKLTEARKKIEAAKEDKPEPEAKPSFDEYKAAQQAKQDAAIEEAARDLEEKYERKAA